MCDRFQENDVKTRDLFCPICNSPISKRVKCDNCETWTGECCMEEIKVLQGSAMVKQNLCKKCVFEDRVEAVRDCVSLMFPFTMEARDDNSVELTFSPCDSDDFTVTIKRG